MKRNPIDVFSEWAYLDKDFGMEENHRESVDNMLSLALKEQKPFTFIDAGCGNGWVVREVQKNVHCNHAIGVDGSQKMIAKAKKIDPHSTYLCENLMNWTPQTPVDLVHSMEVFYYVDDPKKLIQIIADTWLKNKGRLIIGLDFYQENTVSHDWSETCGISNMKLFSERDWISFFLEAGFHSVENWRVGSKKDWAGTLVVTGLK